MSVEEQYLSVQHMLSQRMLSHAESIIRQWAIQLNRQEYYDRIASLSSRYDATFQYYLSTPVHYDGDPDCAVDDERDHILDELTQAYYDLTDTIYADLARKEGIFPTIAGFDTSSEDSMMRYFSFASPLRDEDLAWLEQTCIEAENEDLCTHLVSALAANVRQHVFSAPAVLSLIRIALGPVEPVAYQATAQLIMLLAHYDTRIDFYPDIQQAFQDLVADSDRAFALLGAVISDDQHRTAAPEIRELFHSTLEILPSTGVFSAICTTDAQRQQVAELYVDLGMNEQAFDQVLMGRSDIITDRELRADYYLYNELYDEAFADYQHLIDVGVATDRTYFRAAWSALMIGDYAHAEQYMIYRLRLPAPVTEDYLNYGHLCFVRGDKATAYEYYLLARQNAGSLRHFKDTFCPDRKVLADMGIPLQEIYLMEDRLLQK